MSTLFLIAFGIMFAVAFAFVLLPTERSARQEQRDAQKLMKRAIEDKAPVYMPPPFVWPKPPAPPTPRAAMPSPVR